MKSKFKVHLFRVYPSDTSKPLEDILEQAHNDALAQRMRKVGFQEMRLEDAKPPSDGKKYWLLDFGKMRRDGGPGHASDATPIESFDLAQGEAFAEETAMLFDPDAGIIALQYNHHGPRSGSIADYLGAYDQSSANLYDFKVQLTADAQARLQNKVVFTRLELKVAPALLSDAFKKNNVALTEVVNNNQKHFGGDTVFIEIGLDRMSSGSLSLKKWFKPFFSLANDETEATKHLVIHGRDQAGLPVEPVDLLTEKVEYSVPSLPLDKGLRHPRVNRWSALEAAHKNWKSKQIF
jgi:hypothetical protein